MASRSAWTNVEDEVLKAAVSKYGLNNWARVSSLLARKSAKQCKERYESWIDPRISKQEWSREEDERLLHYARIFSTAWRTIAQLMENRTAAQCIQRYQYLLDEEEKRESGEFGLTGPDGESAAPVETGQKFKPLGDDVDISSKPAIPDAVDMDEDELEMLSEARARLANTQGKKSKRKARERQLEVSRRMALLQKRRELKQSGINIKLKFHKKGDMDYNADIPFERQPAEGFFDTTEEIAQNEQKRANFDPRKQQMAIKRKNQDDQQDDRKKKKRDADSKTLMPPPPSVFRATRPALNLPEPSVTEETIDLVAKSAQAQGQTPFGTDLNGATPAGQTSRPIATPFRTPAQQVQALAQTPARTPLAKSSERKSILAQLESLPKPMAPVIEIPIPEDPQEEQIAAAKKLQEDAAIRDARDKARRDAEELADFRRQSLVIQKGLPRPSVVDIDAMLKRASEEEEPARRLAYIQAAHLKANDAVKFGGSKVRGTVTPLPLISDVELSAAKRLVEQELSTPQAVADRERWTSSFITLHSNQTELPCLQGYEGDEAGKVRILANEFRRVKAKLIADAEKANEMEKRLEKYHGGYKARANMLKQKIDEVYDAIQETNMKYNTALAAQAGEEAAIQNRLQKLRGELEFVTRREREAQETYRALQQELSELKLANGR